MHQQYQLCLKTSSPTQRTCNVHVSLLAEISLQNLIGQHLIHTNNICQTLSRFSLLPILSERNGSSLIDQKAAYFRSAVLVINLIEVLLVSALVYNRCKDCCMVQCSISEHVLFSCASYYQSLPWFCCEVWLDNVLSQGGGNGLGTRLGKQGRGDSTKLFSIPFHTKDMYRVELCTSCYIFNVITTTALDISTMCIDRINLTRKVELNIA